MCNHKHILRDIFRWEEVSILTGGKEEKMSMNVGRVVGGKLICLEMHGMDLCYEVLGNWERFEVVMVEKRDQVD